MKKITTLTLNVLICILVVGNVAIVGVGTASGATTDRLDPPASISTGTANDASINSDCGLSGDIEWATKPGKVGDVRVEKPTDLKGVEHPQRTATEFAEVTRLFNLSDTPQDTVVGVVPPAKIDSAGNASQGGKNVCLTGEQKYLWDGLMAHEYVHTRQEFSVGSDMVWFIEASAFYYMAVVPYQRGTMSRQRANERLAEPTRKNNSSDFEPLILTEGGSDDYALWSLRGTPVLAALDHEIRNRTDGERTLEHVFQAMNDENQEITYSTFKDIVAAVAGERMDSWLDRYVAGSTVVTPHQSWVEGLTLTSSAANPNFRIYQLNSSNGEATGPYPDSFQVNFSKGATNDISVVVENNGTIKDRQTISLLVNDPDAGQITVDEVNKTIAAGDLARILFNTGSIHNLEPGTYHFILATQNDEVRGTLTVDGRETPTEPSETNEQMASQPAGTETSINQPLNLPGQNRPSPRYGVSDSVYVGGAAIIALCLTILISQHRS